MSILRNDKTWSIDTYALAISINFIGNEPFSQGKKRHDSPKFQFPRKNSDPLSQHPFKSQRPRAGKLSFFAPGHLKHLSNVSLSNAWDWLIIPWFVCLDGVVRCRSHMCSLPSEDNLVTCLFASGIRQEQWVCWHHVSQFQDVIFQFIDESMRPRSYAHHLLPETFSPIDRQKGSSSTSSALREIDSPHQLLIFPK